MWQRWLDICAMYWAQVIYTSSKLSTIHSTYMYASIGILHRINGLILISPFDTFSQEVLLNPSIWHLGACNGPLSCKVFHKIQEPGRATMNRFHRNIYNACILNEHLMTNSEKCIKLHSLLEKCSIFCT